MRLVERPRREVMVGLVPRLAKLEYQMAPRLVEWTLARFIETYLRYANRSPVTRGNLDAPMPDAARVHGGWRWSWPRGWSGAALALAAAGAVGR